MAQDRARTGLRTTWDDHKAPELLAKLAGSGESAARQAVAVAARWDAGEARRLLFFPTPNGAGCYAALLPGPKPSGRAMVMFYMRHVKDTFGFALPFVGMQSLGTLFAHENLSLRSQALETFPRISGLEELDWFAEPASVAAAAAKADPEGMGRRFDEGAILRLHERLRDVVRGGATRALIHNDGAPGTGGGGAAAPGESVCDQCHINTSTLTFVHNQVSGSGAFSETLFEKCIPMARVRIPVSRKSRKVPGSNAWTCLSSFFFSEETGFTFFFCAHILCRAQDLGGQILCDPLPRSCAAHRIRQTISCAQPATSCAPHRIITPNLQDMAVISCATL